MILTVPPGHVAAVVTDLEMVSPPPRRGPAAELRRWADPDPHAYRDLFRSIGAEWLWHSRLALTDEALAGILRDPRVEVHLGRDGEGMVELDFRAAAVCEIAFFGLGPERVGRGEGRMLMAAALAEAWRPGIGKVWLHTCTLDHPAALRFYLGCGFRAVRRHVEVERDPRLSGLLPPGAGAHHPVIPDPD